MKRTWRFIVSLGLTAVIGYILIEVCPIGDKPDRL